MIFETHAHYDDEQFDLDREELLSSMPEHREECQRNHPGDGAYRVAVLFHDRDHATGHCQEIYSDKQVIDPCICYSLNKHNLVINITWTPSLRLCSL